MKSLQALFSLSSLFSRPPSVINGQFGHRLLIICYLVQSNKCGCPYNCYVIQTMQLTFFKFNSFHAMNHKVRSNATSVVYCDRYISQWKLPFYSEQVRLIQSKLDLTSLIKMSFGFPGPSLILFLVNCGDTYHESIVFILLY